MPVKKVLLLTILQPSAMRCQKSCVVPAMKSTPATAAKRRLPSPRFLLPDLILMDVVIPGLNGFQATRVIARDDATKHIPVIICTTKSQETDKIWGLRQGRATTLSPIDANDLLDKIARLDG